MSVVVVTIVKLRNFEFGELSDFSDFFNFGKLRYYYNNKGRYNPPVVVDVVVVTVGFCAGLPGRREIINYFAPASRPAGNH